MIGTRLGPYEVIEEAGVGAMATVYRAYHPTMDRFVAVKVIDASLVSNEEAIARFQREARLIARLEHPHILPVYDFDGTHDPPYIVMRYLEGGTIRDVIDRGALPLDEIAYLVGQVGSALDYAHRQGIVHRDIKPANVLIDTGGNAYVSDFGIARIAGEGARQGELLTMTGALVGTPGYMAPEQIQAQGDVDKRADVYALGAMLYELATGALPFQGADLMQVLYQHLNAPVPDARERRPELPPALGDVIRRAMAKAPGDRYASAADLSAAALAAIGGAAVTPSAISAAARESRREILSRRQSRQQAIEETIASFRATRSEWQTPVSDRPPAEHNRNVTAMSVSAVEYAAIVEELEGAVAARDAVQALWQSAREVVADRGGQVYACTEDSMLALWGAGEAQEDDPENAVRAGLAVQRCLRDAGAGLLTAALENAGDDEPFPLQIGIHSGMALLAPSPEGYTVSGTTISLSNRVALRAEGELLISHDTYRSVKGVFSMRAAGILRVRGRRMPLPLYLVEGEKARAFRRTVRDFEGIETRMVGRRAELQILQDAFEDAVEESETQAVTLIGEAGIGKSRLLAEFDAWADLHPVLYRVFQGRATANMTRRPYALVRDVVSFRFEILDSDPLADIRTKIEEGVRLLTGRPDREMAAMTGHLCGFDFSGSEYIRGLLDDPLQLTGRARQFFKRLFVETAARNPILIELEDIHHADDASLDLFGELLAENGELPLLLVCAARPVLLERRPAWGSGQEFHLRLQLQPLSRRESRMLVREILQRVPETPRELRDLLVEQAEGNPFYMEELVKMLLEDRILVPEVAPGGKEAWRVEESRLENLRVPASLDRLLQVRLDTLLYPEKVTLQRAAVVGRVFYDSAVSALDASDETHLGDVTAVLGMLAQRGFIHARETSAFAGQVEYVFDQQMMRDSIYAKLLRRQAALYHAATAEWLIDTTGERVAEYYPLIAEHFEKGEQPARAARYLALSGERLSAVGATADARAAFERALELLPADDAGSRLPLLLSLGEVRIEMGALSKAREALMEALAAAQDGGEPGLQARALYALAQNATRVGDWEDAIGHLDRALELARAAGDRRVLARVLYGTGDVRYRMGQPEAARRACREALVLAREVGDTPTVMDATNRLGTTASVQGDPQEAMGYYQELLALARASGALHRECTALNNMGEAARMQGDFDLARSLAQEALAIAREVNDWLGLVVALGNLARLSIHAGRLDEGRRFCAEAIEMARSAGSATWLVAGLAVLVHLRIAEGVMDEALALLGAVWHHPALGDDARDDVQFWIMPLIREQQAQGEVEARMEAGRALDLDEVADAFLAEVG